MTAPELSVIIVEDDEYVRSLLVRAVGRWFPAVQISAFESGEAAWEELQTRTPQVLLSDYLLSGITGLELADRVRSLQRPVVIILISALALDPQSLSAVNHFLPKPLVMPDLRHLLDSLLRG